jgi:hypothetical protein
MMYLTIPKGFNPNSPPGRYQRDPEEGRTEGVRKGILAVSGHKLRYAKRAPVYGIIVLPVVRAQVTLR